MWITEQCSKHSPKRNCLRTGFPPNLIQSSNNKGLATTAQRVHYIPEVAQKTDDKTSKYIIVQSLRSKVAMADGCNPEFRFILTFPQNIFLDRCKIQNFQSQLFRTFQDTRRTCRKRFWDRSWWDKRWELSLRSKSWVWIPLGGNRSPWNPHEKSPWNHH